MGRTKTRAGAVSAWSAQELKAAAVARVLARQRAPKYATYADPHAEGKVRVQIDGGQGEFAEPATADEWADLRLARSAPGSPGSDLLIRIFEEIRTGGAEAVPAAVGLAAGVSKDIQFSLFTVLNALPPGPGGIGGTLLREWKRRDLQTTPVPVVRFGADPMDRNTPRPTVTAYRTPYGNPAAGMMSV